MPPKSDSLTSSQLFFFAMLFDPDMGVQHIRTQVNEQSGIPYLTQFSPERKRLGDLFRFKRILDAVYEKKSSVFDMVLSMLRSPAHQATHGLSLVFQRATNRDLAGLCQTWRDEAVLDWSAYPV
jgi:hypothetical protein